MEKILYKKFGRAKEEDCITLEVTTWDGSRPVLVIFPKKITKKIKESVENFLLGELDDSDGFDNFKFYCNVYETGQARKRNSKENKKQKI